MSTPTTELSPTRQGAIERDGKRIHWEYFGNGEREAFCLLNGLAMHTKAWYPFLPRLIDEFDVVLYDYPGQGESSADDVPVTIPELATYLRDAMDEVGLARVHVMGISYGGFVALDFARLFHARLHTMTLSGIFLSHEKLFQMYQDLSMRFYTSGPEVFELYTHYMYEKIFGEAFVRAAWDKMDLMRQRFHERYKDTVHSLIRLTLAQDPFFAGLDANMPEYRAVTTPTLIVPGAQDRCIPPWTQKKMLDVFPNSRWEPIEGAGHVVYIEEPDAFWGLLKRFARAKSIEW
jgi:3-oxoadipate enol-lactonase